MSHINKMVVSNKNEFCIEQNKTNQGNTDR